MRLTLFILFVCTCNLLSDCNAQTYILIDRINSVTSNPYMVLPIESGFVVAGNNRLQAESPWFSIFFNQYTHEGDKNAQSFFELEEAFFFMEDDSHPVLQDSIVLWKAEDFDQDYILKYNLETLVIEIIDSIKIIDINFSSNNYLYLDDHVYVGCSTFIYDSDDRDYGLVLYDNGERTDIIEINPDFIDKAYKIIQSNGLIYTFARSYSEEINPFYKINFYNNDLVKIDSLIGNTDFVIGEIHDGIIDSDNNFVFTCWVPDVKDSTGEFPLVYFRNYVISSSYDGSATWYIDLGRNFQSTAQGAWNSIIESNEKDGYIVAGADAVRDLDQDSIFSHAVLAKLNKEGEVQWYRKFSTIDSNRALHMFHDVVSMPDGGYTAVGIATHLEFVESGVSRESIIVKTNSEGLVLGDTLTQTVTIDPDGQLNLNIFPNPTSEILYINTNLPYKGTLLIQDLRGNLVHKIPLSGEKETYLYPSDQIFPGTYFISVLSRDGKVLAKEKFIKH